MGSWEGVSEHWFRMEGANCVCWHTCVHLHPLYCAANPPTTGPKAGPRNGASTNNDVATARFTGGQMSAFVPAPTARLGEPKNPAKKRQTSSDAKFGEKPAPKVNNAARGRVER